MRSGSSSPDPDHGRSGASVAIVLWCLLPRWMLVTRPHVVVNDATPTPLTETPVTMHVNAGPLRVAVIPYANSASAVRAGDASSHTIHETWTKPGDHLELRYHPAVFSASTVARGYLWPAGRFSDRQ